MRFLLVLFMSLFGFSAAAQEKPGLRFPSLATPVVKAEATKLTADFLYVIQSNDPYLVTSSPLGLVSIEEVTIKEGSELRIRARFIEGNGAPETKLFTSKYIWIVEASGVGKVEIIGVSAFTVPKDAVVTRKMLDVDNGVGPRPPPGPKKIASHITFVGAEKTIEATATKNDRDLRDWLDKAEVKVHTLGADSPNIKLTGLDEAVEAAGGAPCAILQSADGKVLGQVRMGTTADVWAYTQKFLAGDK